MKPYIVFAVCALLAGFGAFARGEFGYFLLVTFGLAAIVLPFLIVLANRSKK